MGAILFQNNEKRKFNRKQLYYYLKVNHHQTGMLAGYLGDISTKGLMLFTKEKIEPEKAVNFRIDLDEEFGMGKNLVFEARSLWCEKDVNPEFFIIGFKFIDIDQASIDIVEYLIEKYGFKQ
ncbi:MAG: PilZ domain-containing protein [Proteobacteria bacterium]|nr:PilZ domain-containing protein [Pseudomonadota bacterium]MBU1584805.1 PilZ domain-containing protein [Pseudomonadota bacterium]MBU2629528.1 PilZ domain-containing protein [Pseudomonadota bacterium]